MMFTFGYGEFQVLVGASGLASDSGLKTKDKPGDGDLRVNQHCIAVLPASRSQHSGVPLREPKGAQPETLGEEEWPPGGHYCLLRFLLGLLILPYPSWKETKVPLACLAARAS